MSHNRNIKADTPSKVGNQNNHQPPATPKRNAEATRQTILQAALEEFSEHGFKGTRIENVAKRCGFNKALIYRYFKDKEGLFKATLQQQFKGRAQILERLPQEMGPILEYWFQSTARDPHFMRLIVHEALQYNREPVVEQDYREAYYDKQIEMLQAFQEAGNLSEEFESPYLFLALLSLVVFPSTFPQVTYLATHHHFDSSEFQEKWNAFLYTLAEQLNKK